MSTLTVSLEQQNTENWMYCPHGLIFHHWGTPQIRFSKVIPDLFEWNGKGCTGIKMMVTSSTVQQLFDPVNVKRIIKQQENGRSLKGMLLVSQEKKMRKL